MGVSRQVTQTDWVAQMSLFFLSSFVSFLCSSVALGGLIPFFSFLFLNEFFCKKRLCIEVIDLIEALYNALVAIFSEKHDKLKLGLCYQYIDFLSLVFCL